MSVEVFRSALLPSVPHGFLGRGGGVSKGEMWGLNVGYGSGDDPGLIAENRERAIEAVLPGASLATVHQIHSPTVVYAEQAWPHEERPRAARRRNQRMAQARGRDRAGPRDHVKDEQC